MHNPFIVLHQQCLQLMHADVPFKYPSEWMWKQLCFHISEIRNQQSGMRRQKWLIWSDLGCGRWRILLTSVWLSANHWRCQGRSFPSPSPLARTTSPSRTRNWAPAPAWRRSLQARSEGNWEEKKSALWRRLLNPLKKWLKPMNLIQ